MQVKKKQHKAKIKQGDEVIVIAGRSKGKQGTVQIVKHTKDGKVKLLINGVNLVKKHEKPNPQAGRPGGIQEVESFIDISNVMLFNATSGKGERVGFKFLDDGTKVRYFISSGEIISKNS